MNADANGDDAGGESTFEPLSVQPSGTRARGISWQDEGQLDAVVELREDQSEAGVELGELETKREGTAQTHASTADGGGSSGSGTGAAAASGAQENLNNNEVCDQ